MQRAWAIPLGISAGLLTLLGGAGYWYVFVLQAPPLDAPATADPSGTLSFTVKTFQSQAMGTPRRYGVILPPGYAQHPERRYPVIFMLHGFLIRNTTMAPMARWAPSLAPNCQP